MIGKLAAVEVVTVFAEDLAATRAFYADVFQLETVWSDDNSSVFKLDNLMINVLDAGRAGTLVEPLPVAAATTGPRLLLTIAVDDVDAVCAALRERGVTLLNGPTDRPWGRRTAALADPAGTVWEVAQILS
jgi:lactoylglutathione lyase